MGSIFICRNNWTQSIVHAGEGKRLPAGVASSAHGQDGTLFWKTGQQLRVFVNYGGIYPTTFHGFFNIDLLPHLLPLLYVIFVGTLGFCAVGTLLSSLSANLKTRDIMLPILLYPLIIPIIIGSVKMTGQVLAGEPLSSMMNWVSLTLCFDIIYIAISIMVIDFVLEE